MSKTKQISNHIIENLSNETIDLPQWFLRSTFIWAFYGKITQHVIHSLINNIKSNQNIALPKRSKLCRIAIEMAQNILFYEHLNTVHSENSYILIHKYKSDFFVTTINPIEQRLKKDLIRQIIYLNSLEKSELCKLKFVQLSGEKKRVKGAGIGLIQIALLSDDIIFLNDVASEDRSKILIMSKIAP